jgi:hypothetical protein
VHTPHSDVNSQATLPRCVSAVSPSVYQRMYETSGALLAATVFDHVLLEVNRSPRRRLHAGALCLTVGSRFQVLFKPFYLAS